jgi:hypothetical protein
MIRGDGQLLIWTYDRSTPQVDGQQMRFTERTAPSARQETPSALEGTAALASFHALELKIR